MRARKRTDSFEMMEGSVLGKNVGRVSQGIEFEFMNNLSNTGWGYICVTNVR